MPDPQAPPCQPTLVIPPETAGETLLDLLDAAEIPCVLIRRGGLDPSDFRAQVQTLCPLAQARDVAVLLEDDAELAAKLKCDGVHLNDPAAYMAARQALGPKAIVGVACGDSLHDAMVAGERGADYVAFGTLNPLKTSEADLIHGWQLFMTVPSLALGAKSSAEAGALAGAGADFVALGPEIWGRGEPGPTLQEAVAALSGR